MIPEFKKHNPKDGHLYPSSLVIVQETVKLWQFELLFMESKSELLKKMVGLNRLSSKGTGAQKDHILVKLSRFLVKDLPDFQKRVKAHLDEMQLVDITPETSQHTIFLKFRKLQNDWRSLRHDFQQLETQLLIDLTNAYPITIY